MHQTLTLCLACWLGQVTPAAKTTASGEADADQRVRSALKDIDDATEAQDMVRPMAIVREAFPASREVLHETVERSSAKLQCFALQVLGENGESAKDLTVITKRLQDEHSKVRLAAIMAVRQLGTDGYDALVKALAHETLPNNRKMAVKTLQVWALEKSVPTLVELLRSDRDKGVRNFAVTALEAITRRKLGADLGAWEAHLESRALSKQAREIAAPRPVLPTPPVPTMPANPPIKPPVKPTEGKKS